MPTVEFRLNGSVLEYRCLLIDEDEDYRSDGCCYRSLSFPYNRKYTEWEPVPTVPS